MILKLWHMLTTSRYTRLLEDQIEDLKRERVEMKAEIFRLNQCLIPTLRTMEREKHIPAVPVQLTGTGARDGNARKAGIGEASKIKPVNWMQARQRLEYSSDETGARFERAVEAHKDV